MGLDLYKPEYEHTVRARPQYGASTEQLVNDMVRLEKAGHVSGERPLFIGPALGSSSGTSQCIQALQRDLYRLQGTLPRRPRPR